MLQFLALASFMAFAGPSWAAEAVKPYHPVSEKGPATLHVGERFLYHILYWGLVVGEAEAVVKEKVEIRGRPAFHVEVNVRSRSVIDYLYRVRDTHHSYIDAERFHSLAYEKKLSEGHYRVHEKMTYDQEKHEAIYESITNGSRKIMLIPKDVQDPMSAGFWFRMQAIKPNSQIVIPVNADEKNWELEVEIGGQKRMDSILGQFETVHLIPKIKFQGFFVRRGRIDGWVGLDKNRTPITMKVKVPILGSVSAKLVEYTPGEMDRNQIKI